MKQGSCLLLLLSGGIAFSFPPKGSTFTTPPKDPDRVVVYKTVGTADDLLPVATAERYRERMQQLGRRCDLRLYPGEKHGFFHRTGFLPTLRDTDAFFVSLEYLRGGFVSPENPG